MYHEVTMTNQIGFHLIPLQLPVPSVHILYKLRYGYVDKGEKNTKTGWSLSYDA